MILLYFKEVNKLLLGNMTNIFFWLLKKAAFVTCLDLSLSFLQCSFPYNILKNVSLIHKYGLFKAAFIFLIDALYLSFPLNLDPIVHLIKQGNSYTWIETAKPTCKFFKGNPQHYFS